MRNVISMLFVLLIGTCAERVQAANPIVSGISASSGYYGSVLSIYGSGLNKINAITIGGVSISSYTIVSVIQIDVLISNAALNGIINLNYVGGISAAGSFICNGYITSSSNNYSLGNCWLGGIVPPAGASITIAHNISIGSIPSSSAPSSIHILSGASITTLPGSVIFQNASLQIDNGATFTLGSSSIWNISSGNFINNGFVNFSSSSGGTLRINNGNLSNNGVFNQGNGRCDFIGVSTLSINTLILHHLDVNGALTLVGTGVLQLDGDLQLNGSLVLGASNDLALKGDINGVGALLPSNRKLIFNGFSQTVNSALSLYDADVLCRNLYVQGNCSISNKIFISMGDTLVARNQSSISIQSATNNPSIVNGTYINQGAIVVSNTGGVRISSAATFIHNSTSAIATSVSRMVLASGSNFVYRGSANLIPTISVSGRTYSNLIFESTSGSWIDNIGFSGSGTCTIGAGLYIGQGVTLTNASYTGNWMVYGRLQVDGALPTNPLNIILAGSNESITGNGQMRFNTLNITGFYAMQNSINVNTCYVSGRLYMDTFSVYGASFNLMSGGALGIGHPMGISQIGNFGNVKTASRVFNSNASYIYNGYGNQIAGTGLPAVVTNLIVNNVGLDSNCRVYLSQSTSVTGFLGLIDGRFVVSGSNEINVINPISSAIQYHSPISLINNSSYVEGNLRRKVTTGVYDFPLGTSSNYQLAVITVNSNTNVDNILVHFDKFASGCGYNGNTPSFYAKPTNGSQSTYVSDMLNFGYYTVEPYDATYTLVTAPNISYDAQMLFNGHNNGVCGYSNVNSYYALMKKPVCGGAWGLYGGSFNTNNNQAQNSNSGAVVLKIQGLVSFSQFGAGFSTGTVLPLEMTAFTGEQAKGANQLSWKTLSEESTIKFVIECSENADDFTAIGEEAARGTRNAGADYSFIDAKAGTGIHYYRLKAVGVDGIVSYSEMIALGTKGSISNFNVYPNPAASDIHFEYALLKTNTQTTLKVYSTTGTLIHAETLNATETNHTLDTHEFKNGLYIYEMLSNGQVLFNGRFNVAK